MSGGLYTFDGTEYYGDGREVEMEHIGGIVAEIMRGIKVSKTPTPYAVRCRIHGQVFLTPAEYDYQMDNPDALWMCPICGHAASFDDDNYEARISQNNFGEQPK